MLGAGTRVILERCLVIGALALLASGINRGGDSAIRSATVADWSARREGDGELRTLRDAAGRSLGNLRISRCGGSPQYRVHTNRGWVAIAAYDQDPAVVERLVAAAHDLGPPTAAPPRDERCSSTPKWPPEIAAAAALAALVAIVAALARRGSVKFDVRLPHVVPFAIQFLIYSYWSLYWPGVVAHAPSMVLQIALAFAIEAALSFARSGVWTVGLGPLPIVLSANLFAWFDPIGSVILVFAAIASKTLLRREGRHLLNPSAAGLSAGGLFLLANPQAVWQGLFHTENLAPNMVELILLLSALPLLRFRLALIPLGAALALSHLPGPSPGLAIPGTIIAFALFASDPATTPKTPAGRLAYGLFVGASVWATSRLLIAMRSPDDFAKVLPVPLANLLASRFDRLGSLVPSWLNTQLLAPRWNVVHTALWLLVVLGSFIGSKGRDFEAADHWTYGTPLVVRGADDVPRCADNPAFCRPFAFGAEIAAWVARERGH